MDFLDESHAISQAVETPTGAFWHGVMHRREGDYSNAKYWFRRAGSHEALAPLGAAAADLGGELNAAELAGQLAPSGCFNPMAMVDACEAALRSGGAAAEFCRRVQQAEWETLFSYCYRRAIEGRDRRWATLAAAR